MQSNQTSSVVLPRRFGLVLAAAAGVAIGGASDALAQCDPQWVKLTTNGPATVYLASIALDPINDRILVVGGTNVQTGVVIPQIWSLDLNTNVWSRLPDLSGGFCNVQRGNAVWDPSTQKIFFTMGLTSNPNVAAPTFFLDPVTMQVTSSTGSGNPNIIDPGQWLMFRPTGSQFIAGAAYALSDGGYRAPLWYNPANNSWNGFGGQLPYVHFEGMSHAVDVARDRVVSFGGIRPVNGVYSLFPGNTTYEWNAAVPGQARIDRALGGPVSRAYAQMAYDAARNKVILYGGWNYPNFGTSDFFTDTWEYDGNSWRQLNSGTGPGRRYIGKMIYDPEREQMVLIAYNGTEVYDTWALQSPKAPVITDTPDDGIALSGASTQLSAAADANGFGPLFYQWFHDGTPIANGGRFSGNGTPTLTINPVQGDDRGAYTVKVSNPCGLFANSGAGNLQVTCRTDLNTDFVTDDTDFVMFAVAYNVLDCADPVMPVGCPSDFNSDGTVDDADFVVFASAYNELLCE
jgi:hypothetical protein